MSKIRLYGATSGYIELEAPAVAADNTVNIGDIPQFSGTPSDGDLMVYDASAGEWELVGQLEAGQVPNLDAGKVTTGTFDAARIPNLSANKITSDKFAGARIPAINTFDNNISSVVTTATTYSSGTYYAGPNVVMTPGETKTYLVQFVIQYTSATHQRMAAFFELPFIGWKATGTAGVRSAPMQHHVDNDLTLNYRMTASNGTRTWEWSPSASVTVSSGGFVEILMKRVF